MTTTIKDIAKRAGVSTATVSYVVNGTRFVSTELRERVQTAIVELDYRPNAVAQSLRQKKTRTIGLIVPDNSNPFFAEVAKGVEDAGFDAGVSVILCNSDGRVERELSYLQVLRDKQVDGLIFIATTPMADHLRGVIQQRFPIVVLYRQVPDLHVDMLVVDNVGSGYLATRHLIELGHTRIACIAPPAASQPGVLRLTGFRRAMQDAGLPIDDGLIYHADNRFTGGRDGAEHLLATGIPFTAVVAGNDVMAVAAIRTLQQRGVQVPNDVSIIGFDGIGLGEFVTPSLTTIALPRYDAGQTAFRLLLERVDEGYEGPPRDITLPTQLIVRESTTPPRQGASL